MSIKHYYF